MNMNIGINFLNTTLVWYSTFFLEFDNVVWYRGDIWTFDRIGVSYGDSKVARVQVPKVHMNEKINTRILKNH
jgi:hypothetical protein